jgi:hypothetical protein
MLSKPRVESSDGRNFVASTSSASRSPDGIRIFSAVEPVDARRCQVGYCRFVQLTLHGSDQGLHCGGCRPRHSRRRHQAARSFRMIFSPSSAWSERCAISSLSRQICDPVIFVVTADAILIEHLSLCGGSGRSEDCAAGVVCGRGHSRSGQMCRKQTTTGRPRSRLQELWCSQIHSLNATCQGILKSRKLSLGGRYPHLVYLSRIL